MQEVRLAVVWAVLYSDIFESPAMWVLCVNCGMATPVLDGQYVSEVWPSLPVQLLAYCAIMKT